MKRFTMTHNIQLLDSDLSSFFQKAEVKIATKRKSLSGIGITECYEFLELSSNQESLLIWGGGFEDRSGHDDFGYLNKIDHLWETSPNIFMTVSGIRCILKMHFSWDEGSNFISGIAFLDSEKFNGIIILHSNFSHWLHLFCTWEESLQHPDASAMRWEVISEW
ncbi:hypothetical protein [Neogemmobacter tilapiae]|uniref:Uncharacterized protein n=1 Tax=Neogemmobacter tilapiae TaxID=875041 RepID=A0A918WP40_9RHOB|nr:hypothetical protein [Gemmobacter tilapiae]GHC67218.1 hypothetical protein GCM10007315_35350 [Gemmobacter tilapiae]